MPSFITLVGNEVVLSGDNLDEVRGALWELVVKSVISNPILANPVLHDAEFQIDILATTNCLLSAPSTPSDVVYWIGTEHVVAIGDYVVVSTPACIATEILSIEMEDGSLLPSAITIDEATRQVKVLTTDSNLVGTYRVKVTSTLNGSTNYVNSDMVFNIELESPCTITVPSVPTQSYTINQSMKTVVIGDYLPVGVTCSHTLELLMSDNTSLPNSISTTAPDFTTSRTVEIQETDITKHGVYNVNVRLTLNDRVPPVVNEDLVFTIEVIDPCAQNTPLLTPAGT